MKDLSHLHREVARLEHSGLRPHEIVEALSDLEITQEYVNRLRANPIYQHFLKRLEDKANLETQDVRSTLIRKAHDMLEVVLDIAEDEQNSPGTRLAAARDILDRAGYKPIAKEVRLNVNEGFTSQERESLRRLHDQMRFGGFILDVDFKEVTAQRETRTDRMPEELMEAECQLVLCPPGICDETVLEENTLEGPEEGKEQSNGS